MITSLKPNQIFVCGTNEAGIHAGGAAAQAYKDFGALMGQSRGAIGGQSYGVITLDHNMQKVSLKDIENQARDLATCALANPNKEFLLTPVGTGIAGFTIDEMSPLFDNMPENVIRVGWEK